MEFAVNELGQPVIYIINYSHNDQFSKESHFVSAAPTLEQAERINSLNSCHEIVEQNMVTGEQVPLHFMQRQQEQKNLLLGLYKSGYKKTIFDGLDVRKPFQEQISFPIAPELAKAKNLPKFDI